VAALVDTALEDRLDKLATALLPDLDDRLDKLAEALLVKDSEGGHHIPGTPFEYKHGWVKVGVGVDSTHLKLKKTGEVEHKASGEILGHVDKQPDTPHKGTTTFTATHANGTKVYQGVYKGQAMAALARYHNHAVTKHGGNAAFPQKPGPSTKPPATLSDVSEGSKPTFSAGQVTGYVAPNGDKYDLQGKKVEPMGAAAGLVPLKAVQGNLVVGHYDSKTGDVYDLSGKKIDNTSNVSAAFLSALAKYKPPATEPKPKPTTVPGTSVPQALTGDAAYQHAQATQGSLTTAQHGSVDLYGKTSGYTVVNPYLNKDGMVYSTAAQKYMPASPGQVATAKKLIHGLDGAFAAAKPTTQDLIVHRRIGDSINQLIGPVGSHVGKSFTNKAYFSTTTAHAAKVGNGYAYESKKTLLDVQVGAGSHVILGNDHEKEIILPRGSKFTVVSDEVEPDGTRHVKLVYEVGSGGGELPSHAPVSEPKPVITPPIQVSTQQVTQAFANAATAAGAAAQSLGAVNVKQKLQADLKSLNEEVAPYNHDAGLSIKQARLAINLGNPAVAKQKLSLARQTLIDYLPHVAGTPQHADVLKHINLVEQHQATLAGLMTPSKVPGSVGTEGYSYSGHAKALYDLAHKVGPTTEVGGHLYSAGDYVQDNHSTQQAAWHLKTAQALLDGLPHPTGEQLATQSAINDHLAVLEGKKSLADVLPPKPPVTTVPTAAHHLAGKKASVLANHVSNEDAADSLVNASIELHQGNAAASLPHLLSALDTLNQEAGEAAADGHEDAQVKYETQANLVEELYDEAKGLAPDAPAVITANTVIPSSAGYVVKPQIPLKFHPDDSSGMMMPNDVAVPAETHVAHPTSEPGKAFLFDAQGTKLGTLDTTNHTFTPEGKAPAAAPVEPSFSLSSLQTMTGLLGSSHHTQFASQQLGEASNALNNGATDQAVGHLNMAKNVLNESKQLSPTDVAPIIAEIDKHLAKLTAAKPASDPKKLATDLHALAYNVAASYPYSADSYASETLHIAADAAENGDLEQALVQASNAYGELKNGHPDSPHLKAIEALQHQILAVKQTAPAAAPAVPTHESVIAAIKATNEALPSFNNKAKLNQAANNVAKGEYDKALAKLKDEQFGLSQMLNNGSWNPTSDAPQKLDAGITALDQHIADVEKLKAAAAPSVPTTGASYNLAHLGMVDSKDLTFKVNGDVVHKGSNTKLGTVVKQKDYPYKGTTTFTVKHNDGTTVYHGVYKKEAQAALAQHHNQLASGQGVTAAHGPGPVAGGVVQQPATPAFTPPTGVNQAGVVFHPDVPDAAPPAVEEGKLSPAEAKAKLADLGSQVSALGKSLPPALFSGAYEPTIQSLKAAVKKLKAGNASEVDIHLQDAIDRIGQKLTFATNVSDADKAQAQQIRADLQQHLADFKQLGTQSGVKYHGNVLLQPGEAAGEHEVRQAIAHPSNLTVPEKNAAKKWSGSFSAEMNQAVSGVNKHPEQSIVNSVVHLTNAINKSVVTKPFMVQGNITQWATDKIFGNVGSKIGKTFTSHRFIPTTTHPYPLTGFGPVYVRYHMKPGSRALDLNNQHLSVHGNENEILLGPGQRYRVLSDQFDPSLGRVIELESVLNDPASGT
jgi:hypothetical protein